MSTRSQERKIKIKKLFLPFVFVLFLLSACTGNEEVLKLDDKVFADTVHIQKVINNTSNEEMMKTIHDSKTVERLLTMIDGLTVVKKDSDKVFEQMKSQNVYMFAFSNGKKIETGKPLYAFNILADGTFIFTYEKVNSLQTPRVTPEKHPKLLKQIKEFLELDF